MVATLSTMLLSALGVTFELAAVVALLSEAMMGRLSGAVVGVTEGMMAVGVGDGCSLRTPWGRGEIKVPVGWEE